MTDPARTPRRLVLLQGEDHGPIETVLKSQAGSEVSGKVLHRDLQELAESHRGKTIAAEWLGPLGWNRFLWCSK